MPKMPLKPQSPLPFGLATPFAAAPQRKLPDVERKQLVQLLRQGVSLQRESNFVEAERCYQIVLQRAPDMPEAHNLMGTLALEAKDPGVAVDYFEKAVKGLPKDPTVRHNFGSALFQLNEYHEAIVQLRKALELKPGQIDSIALISKCFNHLGKSDEAVQFADKGLRMDENHPGCRVAKADALINLGHMDEAESLLKKNIADRIATEKSWQSLSAARKFASDAPELEAVRAELRDAALTEEQQIPLHFALAKIANDGKHYDEAMAEYSAAKAQKGAHYDIAQYERRVDSLIEFFNPLFLGARKDFGNLSQRPVFIVGMPRSGTTLTEQIISSHPQVAGAGELGEMSSIARHIGDNIRLMSRYGANLMSLSREESSNLAQRYLKFIYRTSRDSARVTDKMPHNFEQVGLIALLFPNATIIHCKRDAIDNCVSCYMNAFNETHHYGADLGKLGRYYRAYDRLMKHWHKVLPGRIFDNQYETLVADQEGQSRKLIAHCKLEWDDACLNYTKNERSVNTISRWQVRQPIYKTSMKRWKPYEKHLGPLIAGLGDLADVS
ncbi:MAG: sulfotransferase [Aestuariivirga sp.]